MKLRLSIFTKSMFAVLVLLNVAVAQTPMNKDEKAYIEVTGSADQEVVPDEIYISIVIREKYVNKEKLTIESQEEKLRNGIKAIGIDFKNLYLSDANADYVKIKRRMNDLITKKDYTLKVSSAFQVSQVFQELDKLEITDAFIARVSHSKMDSLKKEVKIEAIKSAKNKADYLLSAIGQTAGKPLIIQERENGYMPVEAVNFRMNSIQENGYNAVGISADNANKEEELQFKKIKIQAFIYAKFSIQ